MLEAIEQHPGLELCLFVSGTHLAEQDGYTISEIEDDGFEVTARIPMFDGDRSSEGYARALGREWLGLVDAVSEHRPDIILINGDRGELLPVASVALTLGIPVAHIAGGEITEGAIDDSVRHAVSKLSHLHFVTNDLHARRLCQLGEESWRIVISGEPALDSISKMTLLTKSELEESLEIKLNDPIVLVTYHPETLGEAGLAELEATLEAMVSVDATYVITYPNADPGSEPILERLKRFAGENEQAMLVSSLGQVRYYSMLACCAAMLGNSSSGLWEAPTFRLPVVNLGGRQAGRLRAGNVIDISDVSAQAVRRGLEQAISQEFNKSLECLANPYGNGHAVDKIISVLESVPLDIRLLRKKFVNTCDE